MPKNTNILLIRHAEKPQEIESDINKRLALAGQERAHAYVAYFQNYSFSPNGSDLGNLDYLFVSANSVDSQRPYLTILPLAAALNLIITDTYTDEDYQNLANEILQNPVYDHCNILICWHHSKILDLAVALGARAEELPKTSNWPLPPWPPCVYGWLLQLCYDENGKIDPSRTVCINQQLMYGDFEWNPPNVPKKRCKASEQARLQNRP